MKHFGKKLLALALCLCMCLCMVPTVLAADGEYTGDLVLLLANDMHSNLGTSKIMEDDGSTTELGGVARMAAALTEQRALSEGKNLSLNGGDYSQGTPYQDGYQKGWEILSLAALGFDYVTLGNHEFDVGDQAIENSWVNAKADAATYGVTDELPTLIVSNMFIKYDEQGNEIVYTDEDIKPDDPSNNAFASGEYAETGAVNYAITEVNGYKIGMFALEGEESYGYCKNSDLTRMDCPTVANIYSKFLKVEKECDLVVAISHCGETEDKATAAASEGYLDVIQSAHAHTNFDEIYGGPLTENGVIIYSTGEYAQHLGVLSLKRAEDGKWSYVKSETRVITLTDDYDYSDDAASSSPEAAAYHKLADLVSRYDKALVGSDGYFSKLGLSDVTADTVVMSVKEGYNYVPNGIGYTYVQSPVTAFITDAFNYAAKSQVSFVFGGYVRTSLYQGDFTVADAFNMQSTGESAVDHSAGSSLLVCPMSGAQLATICYFDAMCSGISGDILYGGAGTLHTGNIRYTFYVKDGALNCDLNTIEVYDTETETWEPLDLHKAYLTSFTFESSQNLCTYMPQISSLLGFGTIPCAPYDEATDTYAEVPADNTSTEYYEFWAPYCTGVGVLEGTNYELKAWTALYYYAKSMNGELDDYYTMDNLTQTRLRALFDDVHSSDYYADAVDWAAENGVADGTTDTLFAPDNDCTRAQIITFLWRASGSPEPASLESPFTDVTDRDSDYYKAVLWAVEKGITSGTSATTFAPDSVCTRGQVVTFLWRAAGKPAPSAGSAFTDVPADAFYADAVAWAVEKGITNGTSSTTFKPSANCTRAQIVTFLYRDLA